LLNARNMGRAVMIARLAVTFAAAWFVFEHVDWVLVAGLFTHADLSRLVLGALVLVVQFAVMVWRWQIIIEALGGQSVARAQLAIALGRSMLLGQPLPSTVGGDVVRTVVLSNHIGIAIAARSVISDRIVALGVLIVLVVAMLPFFPLEAGAGSAFVALAAVSLGSLAAFFLLLTHPDWFSRMPWIGSRPALVIMDLRQMLGKRRVLLLSLATHLLGVLLIYELARALAVPMSFFQCMVIVPPTLLVSAVPISLGGWGVREGALAAGFALVGASAEAGVATSVLFGLTGPLIGLIAEFASPLVRMRQVPSKDAA